MKYNQSNTPEEYLYDVLNNWKSFRHSNGGLCKAIESVLKKLERLKKENAELKKGQRR